MMTRVCIVPGSARCLDRFAAAKADATSCPTGSVLTPFLLCGGKVSEMLTATDSGGAPGALFPRSAAGRALRAVSPDGR